MEKFCGIGPALSQFAGITIPEHDCRPLNKLSWHKVVEEKEAKTITLKDMACLLHKANDIKLLKLQEEAKDLVKAGVKAKTKIRSEAQDGTEVDPEAVAKAVADAEKDVKTPNKDRLSRLVRSFLEFKQVFKPELPSESEESFLHGCEGIYGM